MPGYRITLAYDGTDFEGWQVQSPRGGRNVRTVQGVLEAALGSLSLGESVGLSAAGRTDTGVHAVGQVASFDISRDFEPGRLQKALNGLLPEDVRVLDASLAEPGFHARRSAEGKLYRYVLDLSAVQLPTRRRYAGHSSSPLDAGAVQEAASIFVGTRDFASLASSGGSVKTTVRRLTRSEVVFDGPTLVYEVEASGFLRQMVRSMVGGLLAAGTGRLTVEALERALAACDRRAWPAPVEARGLTLVRVDYPASGALL